MNHHAESETTAAATAGTEARAAVPRRANQPKYPGVPEVINGNGAVSYVMKHVCGGMIGYPITPSTEISENFEAARAEGQLNVWGRHPFFVEAEGEHSGQSGALGAALTGGNYVSNASSAQGVLYGMESHYVTAGRKVGGFVLQVAARVVTKGSLNVMAGHDDVYALLGAGYTVVFGSNPQEAADLAAIGYRGAALSLLPVANAMDGFATSHVMSEVLLPEPEALKEYLGDPMSRIPCPTVAQEILFGAKGRVFQLKAWLKRHARDFRPDDLAALTAHLDADPAAIEADNDATLCELTLAFVPETLRRAWRRAWLHAYPQGTRQLVPALVDPDNPGLTGPVQNQPDFQAGEADHRTHFASAVPAIIRQAMAEYGELTGRVYSPVMCYDTDDADYIMVGLGSITDDVRAVLPYLRSQGIKAGLVSVKLLQPFPEAELVAALKGAKAVTVLERCDDTALTRFVQGALFKARSNADRKDAYPGIPVLDAMPEVVTAIVGLGSHDVQPRHLIAAYKSMAAGAKSPLIYIGSQFFDPKATGAMADLQAKLKAAYPETELMALTTEPNPHLLPDEALRIRFHSVGGYGTIATGKLLTDLLSGMLGMHSKSSPKYGSEKTGAPTNYYITLSPEPVLLTNNDLEDCELVMSPDHVVFQHTNPLRGLAQGGTFILQSDKDPLDVWRDLPGHARQYIREHDITFCVIDAFGVARKDAPSPELETRMMGIAFIGAMLATVKQLSEGTTSEQRREKVRAELVKKFGRKGEAIVESNMTVVADGMAATKVVDYDAPEFREIDAAPVSKAARRGVGVSAAMCPISTSPGAQGLFDPEYYEDLMARPFREGTIAESPVLPGIGLFLPPGSGAFKAKGVFRRQRPVFHPELCTGCMECVVVCPDTAIPNTVHELADVLGHAISTADVTPAQRDALGAQAHAWAEAARAVLRDKADTSFGEAVEQTIPGVFGADKGLATAAKAVSAVVGEFPVATPRPFFAAMEKSAPGSGGLYSVVIDPWKCTGCLECVDVCGPHALTSADQTDTDKEAMEATFETLTQLPVTPHRFSDTSEGDLKRMLLDRGSYYSMAGGHGACRGCGEVTASHLFLSLARSVGQDRRAAHVAELEDVVNGLYAKQQTLAAGSDRAKRIAGLLAVLEERLYRYEAGPTGNGPAPTVVVNSTGCSSVYSSTMPATQFIDPWVNSLFQDAQPFAGGVYEGLTSHYAVEVKALRQAHCELADDEAGAAAVSDTLHWHDFTEAERLVLPTVLTISGDGAAYDIGLAAMSRIMTQGTPIKMLVMDTGGYSNTGGQASTASFTGQDSDLARYGAAHGGKVETRKELGLLAAFHPHVFACNTATAQHGHFLECVMRMLQFESGAALLIVNTPCSTENGFAEELSNKRSRLAVESRMTPLFIHDPSAGLTLNERFSLEGNPDIDALWTTSTVQYVDDNGQVALLSTPLTPAEFALGEVRFSKQFKPLKPDADGVPIAEYIDLDAAAREGKTPFIYATDKERHLIKVACAAPIVALVEDRKHYWETLKYLAGVGVGPAGDAGLAAEVAAWKAKYEQSLADREASMDAIADAMVTLTMAKDPSQVEISLPGLGSGGGGSAPAAPAASAPAAAAAAPPAPSGAKPAVWLDPADEPKCTDCGTCYQDLPAYFEKTTIIVDGQAQPAAHFKPGSLDGVEVTPAMLKKFEKVRNTCDSEIIQ